MANEEDIYEMLIRLLVQIQQISGREVPKIDKKTIPIGELPGFDSLNGLELVFMLPEKVVWSGDNLCVSEDGKKALNVEEIGKRLLDYKKCKDLGAH